MSNSGPSSNSSDYEDINELDGNAFGQLQAFLENAIQNHDEADDLPKDISIHNNRNEVEELSELIEAVERYTALLNERNPEKLKEALDEYAKRELTLPRLDKKCQDILGADLIRGQFSGKFSNKLLNDSYLKNIELAALLEESGFKLKQSDFQMLLAEVILKNKVDLIQRLFSKNEMITADILHHYEVLSRVNPKVAELISTENQMFQNESNRPDFLFRSITSYETSNAIQVAGINILKQILEKIIPELEGFKGTDQKIIGLEIEKIALILKQQHEYLIQQNGVIFTCPIRLGLSLKKLEALVNNNNELLPSEAEKLKALIESIFKDVPFFEPINEEINLRDIHSETAMQEVTSEEKGLFYKIQEQYKGEFDDLCKKEGSRKKENDSSDSEEQIDLRELPCYPILSQLEQYLINQFEREDLSTAYPDGASDEELNKLLPQYYNNIFHTAWRYLFARPNPWIAPDAKMAKNNASEISPKEFEKIAYFWLAASDEKTPCTNEFTIKARMKHFVEILAFFGREYNEGLEGDKPTCILGVKKRCYQLLIAHPVIDAAAEELTPDSFIGFFREKFLTSLFAEVNTFTQEELSSLKQVLEKSIMNAGDDLNRIDRQILKLLKLKKKNYHDIDDFIDELCLKFGKKQVKQKVSYQGIKYENYKKLAKAAAKNHLEIFAGEIFGKINSLLGVKEEPKENSNENSNEGSIELMDEGFSPSSPIITPYKNQKNKEIKEPTSKKRKNVEAAKAESSKSYNSSDFSSYESDEEKSEKSEHEKKRKKFN